MKADMKANSNCYIEQMQVIKFVLAPKEDEESLLAHTEEAVKEEESLDIDVPHDTSDLFEQTEDTEEELLRVHQLEDEDKVGTCEVNLCQTLEGRDKHLIIS